MSQKRRGRPRSAAPHPDSKAAFIVFWFDRLREEAPFVSNDLLVSTLRKRRWVQRQYVTRVLRRYRQVEYAANTQWSTSPRGYERQQEITHYSGRRWTSQFNELYEQLLDTIMERGYGISSLAKKCGIARSSIYAWLAGGELSARSIEKILRSMGLSIRLM